MTRKWGRCWPQVNGFNGRIQGNKKSRASNHSLSDSRSSVFSQTNQDLQSPVRCSLVSGLPSPFSIPCPAASHLRFGPALSGPAPPAIRFGSHCPQQSPRVDRTRPRRSPPAPVSRPPIRSLVRLPSTCGLAPSSPGRLHPRIVFGPIIVDRAPESEPGDVT